MFAAGFQAGPVTGFFPEDFAGFGASQRGRRAGSGQPVPLPNHLFLPHQQHGVGSIKSSVHEQTAAGGVGVGSTTGSASVSS